MAATGNSTAPGDSPVPPPLRTTRPRFRSVLLGMLVGVVAVLLAIGAGMVFLASEAGLRFVVAEVVAASDGRLTVDGVEGSLLGTIRAHELAWRGPETTVVASDVAVEWSPLALWSRRVAIRGLGAQRIAIELKPSSGAIAPPAALALPLEVSIDGVGVGEVAWRIGPQQGRVTGLTFGYAGGATEHSIRSLRFAHDLGTLQGSVSMASAAPFALAGAATFAGDAALAGLVADAKFAGTLPAIAVSADGSLHGARVGLTGSVTPFAERALGAAQLTLSDLDPAALDPGALHASLSATIELAAPADALSGRIRFDNAAPGRMNEGRVPITSGAASIHRDGDAVLLDDLRIEMADGGTGTGNGRVVIAGPGAGDMTLELALARVDLARIHSALVSTRLGGRLALQVEGETRRAEGRVADGDLAADFAVRLADGRLDVTRLAARAGGGTLNGSGRFELDRRRAFTFAGTAAAFDPSRFGAYPKASLGGSVELRGTLEPSWSIDGSVKLAEGSRLLGVPVQGRARASVTRTRATGIDADLAAGKNRFTLSGDAGGPDDRLAWRVDAKALGDLAPLLPAGAPPLAGAVAGHGTVIGLPGLPGGDLEATATGLRVGIVSVGQLTVTAKAAPPRDGAALAARSLEFAIDAKRVAAAAGNPHDVKATATGTLAAHRVNVAVKGDEVDAKFELAGGVDMAAAAGPAWRGALRSFDNSGPWPLRLAAPAVLEIARDRVALGEARLEGSESRIELGDFLWDRGRLSSRGRFTAVPAAGVATALGMQLPLESTLRLAGQWSLEATPKLNGTIVIRRERGDIYAVEHDGPIREEIGFGLTEFVTEARFTDDALAATARWRATRAGDGEITADVGASADGALSRNAPLAVTARARMPSLAPLQPWLGTSATVAGTAAIDLAGRGTLASLPLSGTIGGDGLRIDVPQWGVHLTGGRLAARFTDGVLALEDLTLQAGDGRFVATGTIGRVRRPGGADESATRLAWKAEKFRLFNRPDLRLVVNGSGTLTVADGKLRLAGSVKAESGHIEYASTSVGQLADDVVVKGRPRPPPAREAGLGDTPLALDLDLDLGDALTFSGEGLETALTGRVKVQTDARGALQARGTIRAERGTYFAYGQKLVIDRGVLIFDGPLDNPALDIVAVRRTPQVDAGVRLTGTARVPQLTLTSNPPLSEGETLAYLVTGQGLDRASRADLAALQAASAALLGRNQRPLTTTVARSLGLDDISFGSGGSTRADGTPGQVVSFGKRLTDRLSLVYEQGLTVATNGLRIEYALSRTLTLRAEAGTVSGVGIFYRRTMR
jgi:translocation and assembly module TamB